MPDRPPSNKPMIALIVLGCLANLLPVFGGLHMDDFTNIDHALQAPWTLRGLGLLGLPALAGAFLPALIGLAMNVAAPVRVNIVGPLARRACLGTVGGGLGRSRRPGLGTLVAVEVTL